MSFLDDLPVASLTFIAGVVLIIVGYVAGDISFKDAYELLLPLGAGSFGIGFVRNQAGKGTRDKKPN